MQVAAKYVNGISPGIDRSTNSSGESDSIEDDELD